MCAEPVNIFEYEALAKEKIEQGGYDFIAGGATDEITIRRTRAVLDSIMMRPRMMVDISERDLSTTILGQKISFPVMLDPAGNHSVAHPEAELATARAAGSLKPGKPARSMAQSGAPNGRGSGATQRTTNHIANFPLHNHEIG